MVKSILFNGRMACLGWIIYEKVVREYRFLCCSAAAVFWIAKCRCMDFLCFSVGQRVVNAFIFDEKPGLNLVRTLNGEL